MFDVLGIVSLHVVPMVHVLAPYRLPDAGGFVVKGSDAFLKRGVAARAAEHVKENGAIGKV